MSGASATIVSDAVMNPFDGRLNSHYVLEMSNSTRSCQAAHASPRINLQFDLSVLHVRLQNGGSQSILRVVSNDAQYDSTFHGPAILGLRVAFSGHESYEGI